MNSRASEQKDGAVHKYHRYGVGVALYCLLFASGCDGHTRIRGHVTTIEGKPIAGATILLQAEGPEDEFALPKERDTAMTDEHGRYSLDITHAPRRFQFDFVVSKEGYSQHREQITSNTWEEDYTVVLELEDPTPH